MDTLDFDLVGNLGKTYFAKVRFNVANENIISQGAIGARNDAKPGAINATILVEQHTTPLARADAPAIAVDVDDAADVLLVEVLTFEVKSSISQ